MFSDGTVAAYLVLSADPRRRVEADNREEGHDFKPADEQLLVCDQVSGKRATWECEGSNVQEEEEEEEILPPICTYQSIYKPACCLLFRRNIYILHF